MYIKFVSNNKSLQKWNYESVQAQKVKYSTSGKFKFSVLSSEKVEIFMMF